MSVESMSAHSSSLISKVDGGLISRYNFLALVGLTDMLVIAFCGALSYSYVTPAGQINWFLATVIISIMAFSSCIVFQKSWLYTIQKLRSLVYQVGRLFLCLMLLFGAFMAIAFLYNTSEDSSRLWLVIWSTASFILLSIIRIFFAFCIRYWENAGRFMRHTVIIGGGDNTEELVTRLKESGSKSVKILGIFDDRGAERTPDSLAGYPKIGTFEELPKFCHDANVDLLIFTFPITAEDRILRILKKLWALPIDIRLSAHTSKLRLQPRAYSYIGGVPLLALFDKPLTDWSRVVKNVEDLVLGGLFLALAMPLMMLIAVAIKLDSKGPVFFTQTRYGFKNDPIEIYKFRSLYSEMTDYNVEKAVTRDDPRVTFVGRIIRKTSLDELPQLINVMKGDLSLVGPRPHVLHAKIKNQLYEDVVDGYFTRHRIKPGITGWAQINGWRGETDTQEKIEHRIKFDLHYIDNWSVLFDLYIIALTPIALFNTDNAY